MIGKRIDLALAALVFALLAADAIRTGRFSLDRILWEPIAARDDHPVLFWAYLVLMAICALAAAIAAILIA